MIKIVRGTLVAGHGVASGQSTVDRRFPGGTIRLQENFFRDRGVDFEQYFPHGFVRATLNVRCSRGVVAVKRPDFVIRDVKWTETFPPENFFLSRCTLGHGAGEFRGLFYIHDPKTKPDHFQDPRVVEVIAEAIPGIAIGDMLKSNVDPDAVDIE